MLQKLTVPLALLAVAGATTGGALAHTLRSQFISGTVVATPHGALVVRVDHTDARDRQLLGHNVTVALPPSAVVTGADGKTRIAVRTIQPGWRAGVVGSTDSSPTRWIAFHVRVKAPAQRFVMGVVTALGRGKVTVAVQKGEGKSAQRLVGQHIVLAIDHTTRVEGGPLKVGDRVGALFTQGAYGLRALRIHDRGKP